MTLIYTWTKKQLNTDIFKIDDILEKKFFDILWHKISPNERASHRNSLMYMNAILSDEEIPETCGVSIEYHIPQTSKRIDFIITWKDQNQKDHVVIIELKQWQEAQLTGKDGIVATRFQHWLKETAHPSYQARSYAALLEGFNATVYMDNIQLKPCAYLHNYKKDDWVLRNEFYKEYLEKAPLFLEDDHDKLQSFIKEFIKYGDDRETMFRIENWEIRPSKALADSMVWLLDGNQEFIMIDEQKVIYENIINIAKKSSQKQKNVVIVEWWPGTWKSVVAINLLVALTKLWHVTKYVTKNSAPRDVYESKLTGKMTKTQFSNMFTWSWSFINTAPNFYGTLIIDEAHRLNEKSWLFKHLWENQIKEAIRASKCTIFFIDENQKVTLHDIGAIDEIKKYASLLDANVSTFELSSQFRCNGSDWYLARLDNVLQIRETANMRLGDTGYEFKIMNSPTELKETIYEKNNIDNKARIVAWYCWNRISKKDKNLYDITFPEWSFSMRWNLSTYGSKRIIDKNSVSEVWCIHTCQWLEVDYIGVIVWEDFVIRDGKVVTQPDKRAKTDASIKWYKSYIQKHWESWEEFIDAIIKNTYRTLMTRWMKWCYVYFVDKETEERFRKII